MTSPYIPHGPLSSANYIQHMAKQTENEKLAMVLTGLSVILVGKMIWDQFNPVHRQVQEHERRNQGRGR